MQVNKYLPYWAEVIKTPNGPAPGDLMKAWVGIRVWVLGDNFGPELNLESGGFREKRSSVLILASSALNTLENKDPRSAEWFRGHMLPNMELLSLGKDEVERIS
jgi:hypothetical protein